MIGFLVRSSLFDIRRRENLMSHKQRIVSIRIAALVAVTCGLLLLGVSLPRQAAAQRTTRSKITRWEYCAIVDAHPEDPMGINLAKEKYTGVATICYFRSSGCRREEVTFSLSYADSLKLKSGADSLKDPNSKVAAALRANAASTRATESALSKAITKLGDDGWEMVGETRIDFWSGTEVNNRAIYFKRRTR